MKKMLGLAAAAAVALPIIVPAAAMADDGSGSMQPMGQDVWGWTSSLGPASVGTTEGTMSFVRGLGLGWPSSTGASEPGWNATDSDPNAYSMDVANPNQ